MTSATAASLPFAVAGRQAHVFGSNPGNGHGSGGHGPEVHAAVSIAANAMAAIGQ
ncbi:MAG: hypothetical protein JOZ69_17790 [Myxococcales bacterium]|nr:hypothetical protein [Myxococcales bacterium]